MDKQCSKCGGELVTGALLANLSFHPIIITPMEDLNRIKKKKTGVICDACTQCGNIENIRVENPGILKSD